MSWGTLLESLARTGDPKPVPAGSPCGGERSSCRGACAEACPPSALRFQNGQPEIGDGCDGCGLCAAACPSGSLSAPRVERASGSKGLSGEPWRCSAASSEGRLPKGGVLPCLGSLTPERAVLLAAGAGGTLRFKTGNCAECPLGPPSEALRKRLLSLAALLRGAAGTEVLQVDAGPFEREAGLQRRDFFRRLAPRSSEAAAGSLPSRGVLVEALRRLLRGEGLPPGLDRYLRPLRLPAVAPSSCTLCGACALACAPGALRLEASGGRIALRLDREGCTGCGACAEACPERALVLEGPEDGLEGPHLLLEGPAFPCIACGRITLKRSPGPVRCPACERLALRRGESPFAGYGRSDRPI